MDIEESSSSHLTTTGRIKKKPGRKPNPASPALRKAQNRAAQKAFRERKEQKMKELEVDTKQLLQERDYYHKKCQRLSKENDILKCENWYLKGIVLSLQLVCFKTKIRIPRHSPHINEQVQKVMASTIPDSIAAHINGTVQDSSRNNSNNNNTGNDDDILVDDRRLSTSSSPSSSIRSNLTTPTPTPPPPTRQERTMRDNTIEDNETNATQPVMLSSDSSTSSTNNMAAIQSLRLRLRIQSAVLRENAAPQTAKPSPLQLSVPHDPRIDLIPTVHMRDRMILFRDQFDLEDVMRLLVNEAVFHGGNPSVASSWELPAVFFEKYWYLTTDYTLERTSQRWRQLKTMMANDTMVANDSIPTMDGDNPDPAWSYPPTNDDLLSMMQPTTTTTTTTFNPSIPVTANFPDFYRFGSTSNDASLSLQNPFQQPLPPPEQQQPWHPSYPFI